MLCKTIIAATNLIEISTITWKNTYMYAFNIGSAPRSHEQAMLAEEIVAFFLAVCGRVQCAEHQRATTQSIEHKSYCMQRQVKVRLWKRNAAYDYVGASKHQQSCWSREGETNREVRCDAISAEVSAALVKGKGRNNPRYESYEVLARGRSV